VSSRVYCSAQALCVTFTMLLAACGGGGGGSGGPDFSTAPGLTVSPASLSFAAVHNGATPPTQNIQIAVSHPNFGIIVVGFPTGVTPPTWLDKDPSRFNRGQGNNWTFTAAILDTSMAPGTYTTTLRVVIGDSSQNILALRDVQVSYSVTSAPATASPNALNFSSVAGGAAPAAQTVALMGDVGAWTASPNQTWIGVAPSSGFGTGNVSVSVNPAGLGPNTYNGSVTFNTAGGTTPVNVTLTVSAPGIQPSSDSLTFSGVNGATLPSQSLTIGMNNGAALNWTATTPPADTWLVLNRASGTASDALGVSVNPANGALAFGTHNSSIGLQASSGGSTFNKTVNVTMTLTKATLTANPAGVTLGGSNGRDFSGVPVQLSLNTGVNSFSWHSSSSAFVVRSLTTGSVSGTPVSVTLTPNAAGLSGGTHTGSATFSATVNGDTVTANVPVTFNLESHKLLVDGNGVGFAKTPTRSNLTRNLKVRDNTGGTTSWTASKTQSWLTVTASGTAGDDLVLTVNPSELAVLATNTVYFDTVTIDSPDTSVENRGTEKVRVGLWVGASDPTATSFTLATNNVAADPIRPYAYAALGSDIQVYNVFTGTPVTTITGVAAGGGVVGFMIASHDGSTLYALDTTNSKIVPVNLDTQTAGTPFSVSLINFVKVIDYTRTNGVGLIVSGSGGQIFNAQTGAAFPSTFVGNTVVSASRGGTRMCTVNTTTSAYFMSCPSLDFTSLNGGQLLLGNTFEVSGVGSFGRDLLVKPDGAIVYVASGGVSELSAYQTSGPNPVYVGGGNSPAPVGVHPSNAEIAADGRIFASSPNSVSADVWIFNANGTPNTTLQVAASGVQIFERQLRVSADGLRLITITGDPFTIPASGQKLNFTTLP